MKPVQVRCRESGVAIVEFTIVLPLLLLLLLATAEFGRALFQYNALNKTTRDAARLVASRALLGTTSVVNISAQLQSEAANLLVFGNVVGGGTPLLPGLSTGNVVVADAGEGYISVSASYAYTPLIGPELPTFGIIPPVDLRMGMQSTVVMRAL